MGGTPKHKTLKKCKDCGTTENVNPRSRLCERCAMKRVHESIFQQIQKEGPAYEAWKKGILESVNEGDVTNGN